MIRAVRVALCRTERVPTDQEAAPLPEFMGNVARLSAVAHHKHPDRWAFGATTSSSVPGSKDAEKSCIVRSSRAGLKEEDKMFLFIELVTTLHVSSSDPGLVLAEAPTGQQHGGGLRLSLSQTAASLSSMILGETSHSNSQSPAPHATRSRGVSEDWRPSEPSSPAAQVPVNDECVSVELCSGWALLSLDEALLTGRPQVVRLALRGGSPFAAVKIGPDEVRPRAGLLQAMRRAVGLQIKSTLEILITPLAAGLGSSSTVADINQPSVGLLSPSRPTPSPSIAHTLPLHCVLPNRSASVVAMFRLQLIRALKLSHDTPERVLPQSNANAPITDVVLSCIPRFLSDTASAAALLHLWTLEAPKEITGKPITQVTVADAQEPHVLETFKSLVARLYRAYYCVGSQSDPFLAGEESAAQVALREEQIIRLAQRPPPEGGFLSSLRADANEAAAAGAQEVRVDEEVQLYLPFHTRELVWQPNHRL
jgi:hypothetical protein